MLVRIGLSRQSKENLHTDLTNTHKMFLLSPPYTSVYTTGDAIVASYVNVKNNVPHSILYAIL